MANARFHEQTRDPILHLHHMTHQQMSVTQRAPAIPNLSRRHVAFRQGITAQAISNLAGIIDGIAGILWSTPLAEVWSRTSRFFEKASRRNKANDRELFSQNWADSQSQGEGRISGLRAAASHHGRMYSNSHVRQRKPVAHFAQSTRSPASITTAPTARIACVEIR